MRRLSILFALSLIALLISVGASLDARASLLGQSIDGSLTVIGSDGTTPRECPVSNTNLFLCSTVVISSSGATATVADPDAGDPEFFLRNFPSGFSADHFLNVEVDVDASSFSITLSGDYFDNPGGIVPTMQLVLSDLSWGVPPGAIDSVTLDSGEFVASVAHTTNQITLDVPQFTTSFGGPESFTNNYSINHVPEPGTVLLLMSAVSFAAVRRWRKG